MRSRAWASLVCLVCGGYFAACSTNGEGGAAGSGGGGGAIGGSAGSGTGGASGGGTTSGGGGASSGGAPSGGAPSGGAPSGGGSSTGGAAGGGGAPADAGIPDVTFSYDGPVEDDGSIGDACAATTVKAEPAPLDMFIMLDNSGSMGSDCNIGQSTVSKWCYSINALSQFFQSAPAGTGVALQYFPKCWKSTAECTTGASCAVAEVPLGQLPGNLAPLQSSLNTNAPLGGTPMEAALHGLAKYTTQNQQPGRVMIGIFVTDGVPEGCTTNANTLAGIVQSHLTNDKIKTFVIGMDGADFGTLDTIAAPGGASPHTQYCGGSSPCYSYDVDNGNPAAFTAVLAAIQKSAVACQFSMPTTDGGIVDPSKVEVQYFPAGNPPAQKLPKVTNAAACSGGGWYFDNNANPKSILLCPSSCTIVQLDTKAKIDISLGCLGS
ncbi:MAG: VWA domain-containing protein [Myxococcales bacterium]|nr:VWA domain-containing protein [Myxococcales bacterium]